MSRSRPKIRITSDGSRFGSKAEVVTQHGAVIDISHQVTKVSWVLEGNSGVASVALELAPGTELDVFGDLAEVEIRRPYAHPLASETGGVEALLAHLRERYDFVAEDAPDLCALVDMLVERHESTEITHYRTALQELVRVARARPGRLTTYLDAHYPKTSAAVAEGS